MSKDRAQQLREGIGKPRQSRPDSLRHSASKIRYWVTQEKPSTGVYNTPGRGSQGESSN